MKQEWYEVEESAQELLYKNSDSGLLYVTDGYRGRLNQAGERYRLIYAEPLEGEAVLETGDDLDELEAIADDLVDHYDRVLKEAGDQL